MKKYFYVLLILVLLNASCAGIKSKFSTVRKPSEDECLKRLIGNDIDANARLSEIPVLVESVSGGNVKLKIPSSNKRVVSDKAVLAVRRGESLQNIERNDGSVNFLIEFEKQLKRMPRIKTVSWTADEPCAPGFVCQTSGSSERSADADELDALCAEYRK